jgi:hypothetical protein
VGEAQSKSPDRSVDNNSGIVSTTTNNNMNPLIDGSNDDGVNPIISALEAGKIARAKLRASMEGASSTTQALSDEGDVRRVPMYDQGNGAEMDNGNNDDDDDERPDEYDIMNNGGRDSDEEESDNEEDDDNEDDEDIGRDDEEEIGDKIVEKFILTFHNGNYDAEFDHALSFDRSETLPNEPTQASYIKPDNWVERNRIGLEKTREQLQTYIDLVLHGNTFELKLTHNTDYYDTLMDNEEPIVWHEPILDDYWEELEAKIDGRKKLGILTKIEHINIENVEIKKERLAALVAMFLSGRATNSSTDVFFENVNLCVEGIMSLSKLVDVSPQLITLIIRHNQIDNMESAQCLSRSLKSHTCVNQLHLTHCDLGSSPEILSVILHTDVKYINLEHNNIDSLGAVKIAQYLEGDPHIFRINLGHNRLNDDDAILISQALKKNRNLSHLYLWTNNLSCIGVKALFHCVIDSSSLNAISESNHTKKNEYVSESSS